MRRMAGAVEGEVEGESSRHSSTCPRRVPSRVSRLLSARLRDVPLERARRDDPSLNRPLPAPSHRLPSHLPFISRPWHCLRLYDRLSHLPSSNSSPPSSSSRSSPL